MDTTFFIAWLDDDFWLTSLCDTEGNADPAEIAASYRDFLVDEDRATGFETVKVYDLAADTLHVYEPEHFGVFDDDDDDSFFGDGVDADDFDDDDDADFDDDDYFTAEELLAMIERGPAPRPDVFTLHDEIEDLREILAAIVDVVNDTLDRIQAVEDREKDDVPTRSVFRQLFGG